jgi:hypothetical protein
LHPFHHISLIHPAPLSFPAKAGIQFYQVLLEFTLTGASRFAIGMAKKIKQNGFRLSKAPCINFLK